MRSSDEKSAGSWFFGAKRADGSEVRAGRRRFRPAVAGLEGRQLLAASALSTLATFHGANQSLVGNLVADSQGDLFGSTSNGGPGGGSGNDTVFEIPHGSKSVTTLATFTDANGYNINGLTLDGRGDLLGTLGGEGGAYGHGEVFDLPAGSKSVATVATFNGTNGSVPNGAVVIDGQGNLFGTTAVGGATPGATLYEIPAGTNTVVTLASFNNPGAAPKGLMIDGQGDLYGTDSEGGANGAGTVFEVPRGSSTVATLASFPGVNGSGISQVTPDSQGNLFGTTEDGGTFGNGTVFEIARGSGTVTTLASFNGVGTTGDETNGVGINAREPDRNAGVVIDAQGNLYGTTRLGGVNSAGTIFEIPAGSNTVTTLASFGGSTGINVSGLKLDGQGNLVGTSNGSSSLDGTVFKLALNNQPAAQTLETGNSTAASARPVTVAAEQLIAVGQHHDAKAAGLKAPK